MVEAIQVRDPSSLKELLKKLLTRDREQRPDAPGTAGMAGTVMVPPVSWWRKLAVLSCVQKPKLAFKKANMRKPTSGAQQPRWSENVISLQQEVP